MKSKRSRHDALADAMPPSGRLIRLRGCRILRDHRLIEDDLWIRDGKIVDPQSIFYLERIKADVEISCPFTIAPGFIDIQINGWFSCFRSLKDALTLYLRQAGCAGVDFSTCTSDSIECALATARRFLLCHGVTAFCPTIVTSTPDTYRQVLPYMGSKKGGRQGAEIIGAHLEGPFLNVKKKGAHSARLIRRFDDGLQTVLGVYGTLDTVRVITIAPEIDGAVDVIRALTERGIRVSLGHSMADLPIGEAAVEAGASCITHLFNAMAAFHHRDPGLFGLLASSKIERRLFYGIISDNVHAHPSAQRIAFRTDPDSAIIVTDAIQAMGLGDGCWTLGTQQVEISGMSATLAGSDTLAGSVATMDECIRNLHRATNCPLEKALESASLNPAAFLGLEGRKGSLSFGADADIAVLDDDLNVVATFIAGECVYSTELFNAHNSSMSQNGWPI